MAAALQNAQFWEASVPAGLGPTSAQNGGSGTQVARHQVTERDGRDGSASLLSSQAMPSFRLGEAAGQFTDVTGADQLADGRVTGRRHGPVIAGGAAAPDPPLPARSACRLCVAGRWRVRRSRAARNSRFWCLSFADLLCPGRIACGALAGWQIRALGRDRPCRWPCRAVGGRASGVDVAAGPRSASQPGQGNRPGSRRPQRQPDGADGASEARPASEPFRLMEPQQV
jgi:hypothetical protein